MASMTGMASAAATSLSIGINGTVGQRGFNSPVDQSLNGNGSGSSRGASGVAGGVSNFVAPNLTVPDASQNTSITDDVLDSLRSESPMMNTSTSEYVLGKMNMMM